MNHNAYNIELLSTFSAVPESKKAEFVTRFGAQSRNPTVIFGFSIWLGTLGVDRFLLGQTLLGALKLISLGGLGIWAFIDLFLVAGVARDKNIDLARQILSTL